MMRFSFGDRISAGQAMHRTQILLEEQQYVLLRNRAQREGVSLGEPIRSLIDIGLQASKQPRGEPRPAIASLS